MKISSNDILNLLYKKHSQDVCISECKTGPTWYALQCLRLDFVAFKRSWKKPFVYGYEIKVSRDDFLQDDKWRQYLDYCTDFYFVCPSGVIDKDELPQEAGLLVASRNAKNLYVKKKAPSRDIDIPNDMYKYILISRTKILDERYYFDNKAFWTDWLKEKDENKKLGYNVSKKIRQIVEEHIETVDRENRSLRMQIKALEDVKTFLLKLGFDEYSIKYKAGYWFEDRLNEKIKEMQSGISNDFRRNLKDVLALLTKLSDMINN